MVSRHFQPLHLRGEGLAAAPHPLGEGPRTQRQQLPVVLPGRGFANGVEENRAVAEAEVGQIQQTPLDALHGEGQRAPHGDGVQPQLVAKLRGLQHQVRVPDSQQGTQGENVLVFHPHGLAVPPGHPLFAADHAIGTGGPVHLLLAKQVLGGEALGLFRALAPEIQRGQYVEAIEHQQVPQRARGAVFFRGGAEAILLQPRLNFG